MQVAVLFKQVSFKSNIFTIFAFVKLLIMTTIRKLPIGIQDFEYLRKENFLYVDKTQYVYQLAHYGKPYFLGRPRRFGKSLFLSTLKVYFEGKKELFEGLKIAELEKEWTKYPVIYLDFNVGEFITVEKFTERLSVNVEKLELLWGKNLETNDISSRFEATIINACQQTGEKVVVLIDEYDKPPTLAPVCDYECSED